MMNYIAVTLAILSIVLPPVKKYVKDKMKGHFKMLKSVQDKESPKQMLVCDPYKPKTKFNIREYLTTHNELWKFYIDSKVYKFKDLDDCDDISVFFTIMSKAGCFTEKEAEYALDAKSIRNLWAHPSIQTLNDKYTRSILDKLEGAITILPDGLTEDSRRNFKQLKEFGCEHFFQHMKHKDVTKMCSSLKSINIDLIKTVTSIMDSTINEIKNKEKDYEINDNKLPWHTMPITSPTLRSIQKTIITNTGKSPNIQSILSSSVPKFKTVEKIGLDFKISANPFAEGSCRIAYKGRFEPDIQDDAWFQKNSYVVVKDLKATETARLQEDCTTYLELREYANEFANKFNEVRGKVDTIEFIEVFLIDILENGDYRTMETYLNKKMYRKWSNNGGFVNVSEYQPVLDAFSHWTHEYTKGHMIVVDLQGEKKNKKFYLTDPVIHSSTGNLFGDNNSRLKGINRFFKTHICNNICRLLELTKQQV